MMILIKSMAFAREHSMGDFKMALVWHFIAARG